MAGSTALEGVLVDKESLTQILRKNREKTRITPQFSSENTNHNLQHRSGKIIYHPFVGTPGTHLWRTLKIRADADL